MVQSSTLWMSLQLMLALPCDFHSHEGQTRITETLWNLTVFQQTQKEFYVREHVHWRDIVYWCKNTRVLV